jgi:hypothetical protein
MEVFCLAETPKKERPKSALSGARSGPPRHFSRPQKNWRVKMRQPKRKSWLERDLSPWNRDVTQALDSPRRVVTMETER